MVVHPASNGISRVPPYSRYHAESVNVRLRDSHPLRSPVPEAFDWSTDFLLCVRPVVLTHGPFNPAQASATACATRTVWALPGSLAATTGILSFPQGTEMFQFPRFPRCSYVFTAPYPRITTGGLPHSDILGSSPTRGSPRRFVAWSRPSSAPNAKASTVCFTCESARVPA
jgi:hypothetical protein